MAKFILVCVLLLMGGVVYVLARGIGTIGKSDLESRKLSNRMMRWRVGLQFAAVALIALLIVVAGLR